jgi:hypothetical protein
MRPETSTSFTDRETKSPGRERTLSRPRHISGRTRTDTLPRESWRGGLRAWALEMDRCGFVPTRDKKNRRNAGGPSMAASPQRGAGKH